MKYSLTIDIAEKTCGKFSSVTGDPIVCPFVMMTKPQNGFSCALFPMAKRLKEGSDYLLMRNQECLRTLKPTEEKEQ